MKHNLKKRLVLYFLGLFIMTVGIAISVKSDLGVSPVSSIPYTLTCVWGIEMGKATILFHAVLVVLQIAILRKKFQVKNLLQVPVGVVFGYFTTFSNYLMSFAPDPQSLVLRLVMLLVSVVLIAVGIFFYLPANIMPLAGEGVMQAISDTLQVPFPRVKVAFDVTMVAVSLATCPADSPPAGQRGRGHCGGRRAGGRGPGADHQALLRLARRPAGRGEPKERPQRQNGHPLRSPNKTSASPPPVSGGGRFFVGSFQGPLVRGRRRSIIQEKPPVLPERCGGALC